MGAMLTGASSDGISCVPLGCASSRKWLGERQSMATFVEVCVVCVGSFSSLRIDSSREAPNPSSWSVVAIKCGPYQPRRSPAIYARFSISMLVIVFNETLTGMGEWECNGVDRRRLTPEFPSPTRDSHGTKEPLLHHYPTLIDCVVSEGYGR